MSETLTRYFIGGHKLDFTNHEDTEKALDLIEDARDRNAIGDLAAIAFTLADLAIVGAVPFRLPDFSKVDTKEAVNEVARHAMSYFDDHKKAITRAKRARLKEIEEAELAPFHDEACRWKHNQKVYFGKPFDMHSMDMGTLKMSPIASIDKGEWCRVYAYQPRKRLLWLCHPLMGCRRKNVIDRPFTLHDIRTYQISRTELDVRERIANREGE